MGRFDYQKSNIHNHIIGTYCNNHNEILAVTLSAVLKDLFKGQHKGKAIRQQRSESAAAYDARCKAFRADPNDALFRAKSGDMSKNEQFFEELFPRTLVGTSRNGNEWSGSQIRAFLGGQSDNGNYGPGDNILKSLDKDPTYTVGQLVSTAQKLFDRERYEYAEADVTAYLEGWMRDMQDNAMPNAAPTTVELLDSAFCELRAQKRLDVLLARLLLTMVAALQPAYGYREFSVDPTRLKLIWFSMAELTSDDVDVRQLDPQTVLNTCAMWYENGRYEESFRVLSSLSASPRFADANETDRARGRFLLAQHLLHGHGCDKHLERAIDLLENCPNHPQATYLLSGCYRGIYDASLEDHTRAAAYMLEAARLGHRQAMLDLAKHCIVPSAPLNHALWKLPACRDVDRFAKARELLDKAELSRPAKHQQAAILYLRGLILEHDNRVAEATQAFKAALQLGNTDALKKLRHIKRDPRMVREQAPSYDCSHIDVLTNAVSGSVAELFLTSLKGNVLSVYTTDKTEAFRRPLTAVGGLRAFLEQTGLTAEEMSPEQVKKRRVAVFFSEDEQKNLYDALELLDLLYNVIIEQDPSVRATIMDTFDVYVLCDYRKAAMYIDANLNDMLENIYCKVHICDPDRDASHQLLHDTPLFAPLLQQSDKRDCRVVVLSDGMFANTLAREIVGVGHLGRDVNVSLDILTPSSQRRQARFYADLPGLYKQAVADVPSLRCIVPRFRETDTETLNPTAVIADREHPLHAVLTTGDYFVVDVGTDAENARLAILLRQELLKSTPSLDKTPVIAVRCRDARAARSVDTAMLGNKPQGSDFWDQYDLHIFGTYDTLYAAYPLLFAPTRESLALAVHCCYDEVTMQTAPQNTLASYYRSCYNQDSSLVTAISLRYRLYAAGLYADKPDLVFDASEDEALCDRYEQWLCDGHLDDAGRLEQSRWNGFMLSRGWEAATLAQVQAYGVQTANGQHRHMLAKLHPFICEWEDFDETDQNTIFSNLKNAFGTDDDGAYLIKNPKETTLKAVRDIGNILRFGNRHVQHSLADASR